MGDSSKRLELADELETELKRMLKRVKEYKAHKKDNPGWDYRSKEWARLKRGSSDLSDVLVEIRKCGSFN